MLPILHLNGYKIANPTVLARIPEEIRRIQEQARDGHGDGTRPRWPMIILQTPKGWTGPKIVDGVQVEGTCRAHQVPIADVRNNPEHLRQLEEWMRGYRPDELFDGDGGLLRRDLDLPDFSAALQQVANGNVTGFPPTSKFGPSGFIVNCPVVSRDVNTEG